MKCRVCYLNNNVKEIDEEIIEESPFLLRINQSERVLLRTPTSLEDDKALAVGICFTEGLIRKIDDIHCIHVEKDKARLRINENKDIDNDIFNKTIKLALIKDKDRSIGLDELLRCMDIMESNQFLRKKTRASHAAMLFSYDLTPMYVAEDVGRHNAFDKVIGMALLNNRLEDIYLATLSSRISFEMAKKGAIAGIKVLMGISRPTSMAILLAKRIGMTIVTLTKEGIIVFSNEKRIRDVKKGGL